MNDQSNTDSFVCELWELWHEKIVEECVAEKKTHAIKIYLLIQTALLGAERYSRKNSFSDVNLLQNEFSQYKILCSDALYKVKVEFLKPEPIWLL